MLSRVWIAEIVDAARTIAAWLRTVWAQHIWPLLATTWILFVLAAPLILVILVLWYLDASGWQAGKGFYTIGAAAGHLAPALQSLLA
jgi:hypothetical protein